MSCPRTAAIVATLLLSCRSGPQTTVDVAAARSPAIAPPQANTKTFLDAIANFDLTPANVVLTPDQRSVLDALAALRGGDLATAQAALAPCWRHAVDHELRSTCRSLAADVAFERSAWREVLEIDPSAAPGILAAAFATKPAERREFRNAPPARLWFSETGQPMMDVQANGRVVRFWLDTGAGLTVVASDVAATLRLTATGGRTPIGTATSTKVTAQAAVLDTLDLGGVVLRHHPVMILDAADLELRIGLFETMKINGIVGWNALRHLDVWMDAAKQQVTIAEPAQVAGTAPRNLFWIGRPIVELVSPGGVPFYFELDTGSNKTSTTPNLLRKIAVTTEQRAGFVGGAGGGNLEQSAFIPELRVHLNGDLLTFRSIRVNRGDVDEKIRFVDGRLGVDVTKLGRAHLDAVHGRFEVIRTSP
jgi:hypothetical protein